MKKLINITYGIEYNIRRLDGMYKDDKEILLFCKKKHTLTEE